MAKFSMSEEALNHEIIKELCSGRQLMDSMEEYRERNSAQIAQDYKGCKSVGGLMHLAEIPQSEFFKLNQWLGHGWENDRATLRHVQKTHPHLFSHKA
jgi:hypothetical protein